MPFAQQLFALLRWQLVEAFVGGMQTLPLLRRETLVLTHVFPCLLALRRGHLLPVGNPLANLFAPLRWQGSPVIGALEQVGLAPRRKPVPVVLQRCQHLALRRAEAVPRTRR